MAGAENFINPYNFIPMGRAKGKADGDEEKRIYTGVIEYSVLTKSPLFIPNTSNNKAFKQSYEFDACKEDKDKDKEHKSYDFYSYQNLEDTREDKRKPQTWEDQYFRPVIPGSEIRGMFRSNFEILTNSCMSALDTDTVLSKRTMERFHAGLLKKNGDTLALYEAKDALWRTKGANSTVDELKWNGTDSSYYTRQCYIQNEFPEGCRVSFREEQRGAKIKSLAREVKLYNGKTPLIKSRRDGYIIKGEKGPDIKPTTGKIVSQKHCCHIFYNPGNRLNLKERIPLYGNKLDFILREYEKLGNNTYKEYQERWEQFKKAEDGAYFPVYYSLISDEKEDLFLSPACITREIYNHTLSDLAGGMRPCTGKDKLCPACSLFGTVMENDAVASRIRFSDLVGEERENYKECYESITTLPPLSSPKLNNMEFYLERPKDAWFWTYDYYIDKNGNIILQQGKLAGRKFYWHNVKNLDALKKEWEYNGEVTCQNITVRPLKERYTFNGKLYFKKLTQKELSLLIYLINTGDEEPIKDKKHGYKLGAAKPLGFGSIACQVDEVKLISYQKRENTIERLDKFQKEFLLLTDLVNGNVEKNFKKMTNFKTATEKGAIRYPVRKEEKDSSDNNGYEWFVNNHGGYNRQKKRNESMASNRVNMLYSEYMEAMETKLKQTGAGSGGQERQRRDTKPYNKNAQTRGKR